MTFGFSQKVDTGTGAVIADATIKTFYATNAGENGTKSTDFDCCLTAKLNADCPSITQTVSSVANTMITGRIVKLGTAS